MGSQDRSGIVTGKTFEIAMSKLVEQRLREYGHQDGYNGTESTVSSWKDMTYSGVDLVDVVKFILNSPMTEEKMVAIRDMRDSVEKRCGIYFKIGEDRYAYFATCAI